MKTLLLLAFSVIASGVALNGQIINPKEVPPDLKKQFPDSMMMKVTPDVRYQFPGSSRFYRKWPQTKTLPYERSFFVRPDTTVKYYLIIKDPLTNKVTKY